MKKTQSVYAKHTFSESEMTQIATDLAVKCQDNDSIEDEKKSIVSSFASKLNSVKAEINRLSNNYRQGYEFRTTECEVFLDTSLKIRKYKSVETGEVVKEEPFLPEDFQTDAFDPEEK